MMTARDEARDALAEYDADPWGTPEHHRLASALRALLDEPVPVSAQEDS